jgi:hypothetical protein
VKKALHHFSTNLLVKDLIPVVFFFYKKCFVF